MSREVSIVIGKEECTAELPVKVAPRTCQIFERPCLSGTC